MDRKPAFERTFTFLKDPARILWGMVVLMRTLLAGYGIAATFAWLVVAQQDGVVVAALTFWIGGAIVTLGIAAVIASVQRRAELADMHAEQAENLRQWDEDARLERLEAELHREQIQGSQTTPEARRQTR